MKEEGYDTVGSYNPMDWIAGRFQPKEIELPDYGTVAADVALSYGMNIMVSLIFLMFRL